MGASALELSNAATQVAMTGESGGNAAIYLVAGVIAFFVGFVPLKIGGKPALGMIVGIALAIAVMIAVPALN